MKSKLIITIGFLALLLSFSPASQAYVPLFGNQTQDCYDCCSASYSCDSCSSCGSTTSSCSSCDDVEIGYTCGDSCGTDACTPCNSYTYNEAFKQKMSIFCNVGES